MIEAISRRGLRWDRLSILRIIVATWIFLPDPLRRRIYIDLHDDFESDFICKPQQEIQILQVILAFTRLAHIPLDPCADGIESELLDLEKVVLPESRGLGSHLLQHRRASFAPAVPNRN